MPLREDLLNPIPGDNPSGEDLRYVPVSVHDKIKEARRQEDELPQGDWKREVKKADYAQVVELAGEALATQSKDLQLAAWLTEALAHQEGISGLQQGLDLMRELIENFGDTLYPELDDGYADMRAGILDWVGSHLDEAVRRCSLTRNGFDWLLYAESRQIAPETECESNEAKREARVAHIADNKVTPEQFDAAVNQTPREYYVELMEKLNSTQTSLKTLGGLTETWTFEDEEPSFSGLRTCLEGVEQTVRVLLAKKPKPVQAAPPAETVAEPPAETVAEPPAETVAEPPAETVAEPPTAQAAPAITAAPADRDDAFKRVVAAAQFLRQDNAYSPVPYLMLRALRWGEIRAGGADIDQTLLDPPSTEVRQELKRRTLDGQWQEVLEAAETAMGMPCGRGWLDLQRYVVRALSELGSWYDPIANSIRSELKALIADHPALPEMTLMDDTPTANKETRDWLQEVIAPPAPAPAEPAASMEDEAEPEAPEAKTVPGAYELATEALRSGRPGEAMSILTREIAQVKTGRVRFRLRTQLAQICLDSGRELIALPILQDLAAEIENRRLEEWEAPEVPVHPLVLLFRCMAKLDRAPAEKQAVYERICRLDPVQAMACAE